MMQDGRKPDPGLSQEGGVEAMLRQHACPDTAATLALIGNKWAVLVIMLLSEKRRRFNELKRLIGSVSQRMLARVLRDLERAGLVSRTVFPSVPPRVEYELTALGHSLKQPVLALGSWAIHNQPALDAARRRFDAQNQAA